MEELAIMTQIFGGAMSIGLVILQAALVVCFFLVFLYKPERVKILALFRWACACLACSVIAPSILSIISTMVLSAAGGSRFGSSNISGTLLLVSLTSVSGPVLVGLSMFFAFSSLTIVPRISDSLPPMLPKKHPLD